MKEIYKCKHFGCNRRCYILFNADSSDFSLWYNNHDHTNHDHIKVYGINDIAKREIERLVHNKVVFPVRILNALRNMAEKQIPHPSKRFTDIDKPFIDNPNYVEGLIVPSKLQIKNYIQNTLKPKTIPTSFNYSDLVKWVKEHSEVPDDGNEPYVIAYDQNVNDFLSSASTLRVSLTTKNLISLAQRCSYICSDATYKVIWQGESYYSIKIILLFHTLIYLCYSVERRIYTSIFIHIRSIYVRMRQKLIFALCLMP